AWPAEALAHRALARRVPARRGHGTLFRHGASPSATRRDISSGTSSITPQRETRMRYRTATTGLAALLLLALSLPASAQDTGTSGIPLGPANINGQNNTLRDPSGIGNAARAPALPQPNLNPVPVPGVAPLTSTQPSYVPRARYRRAAHLPKRE